MLKIAYREEFKYACDRLKDLYLGDYDLHKDFNDADNEYIKGFLHSYQLCTEEKEICTEVGCLAFEMALLNKMKREGYLPKEVTLENYREWVE